TDAARVTVVDANLARPALAERLGLSAGPGLREVLTGRTPLPWAVQNTRQTNLRAPVARRSAGPTAPAALPPLLARVPPEPGCGRGTAATSRHQNGNNTARILGIPRTDTLLKPPRRRRCLTPISPTAMPSRPARVSISVLTKKPDDSGKIRVNDSRRKSFSAQ